VRDKALASIFVTYISQTLIAEEQELFSRILEIYAFYRCNDNRF